MARRAAAVAGGERPAGRDPVEAIALASERAGPRCAGRLGPPTSAAVRTLGADHGRELRLLGITVNFALVVDLRNFRAPDPLDFNSLISRRAFSGDPAVVDDVA